MHPLLLRLSASRAVERGTAAADTGGAAPRTAAVVPYEAASAPYDPGRDTEVSASYIWYGRGRGARRRWTIPRTGGEGDEKAAHKAARAPTGVATPKKGHSARCGAGFVGAAGRRCCRLVCARRFCLRGGGDTFGHRSQMV